MRRDSPCETVPGAVDCRVPQRGFHLQGRAWQCHRKGSHGKLTGLIWPTLIPACSKTLRKSERSIDARREELARESEAKYASLETEFQKPAIAGPGSTCEKAGRPAEYTYASETPSKAQGSSHYPSKFTALVSYFGTDRRLDSITAGDAELWRIEQAIRGNQRDSNRKNMEDNSVRRRTSLARQFFHHAVKRKLISENPFDRLAAAIRSNDAKRKTPENQWFRGFRGAGDTQSSRASRTRTSAEFVGKFALFADSADCEHRPRLLS